MGEIKENEINDKIKELHYDNRTLYSKNKNLEFKVSYLEKRLSILWFLVIYVPIIFVIIKLLSLWLLRK